MSGRANTVTHRVTLRDGFTLNVLDHGGTTGPPILFVHGAFGHAHLWDFVIRALPDDRRVLSLDTLGHGESEHAPHQERYDFEKLADDVVEVVRWIGTSVVVAGQSAGSAITQIVAGTHPDLVDGGVFMDFDPHPPKSQAEHLHEIGAPPPREYESFEKVVYRESRGAPLATAEAHQLMATNGYKQVNDVWVQKFDQAFLRNFPTSDRRALINDIVAPVLVLRGSESTVNSPEGFQEMLDGLPNGRGEVIAKASHQLHLDQPEAVGAAIARFLDEVVRA